MVRLSVLDWFFFLTVIVLGILGAVLDIPRLVLFSLLILFVVLSVFPKFRHRQMAFLFPLSFVSCLPVNVLLCRSLAGVFDLVSFRFSLVFILILAVLVSIEELLLGFVGLILWGKQEAPVRPGEKEMDQIYSSPAHASRKEFTDRR